jgi:hypothetical protein
MTPFEPVHEPITEDDSKVLIVEAPPRIDRRGRITAIVQTWNGKILHLDEVILTLAKERERYAGPAAQAAEESAARIEAAMVKLEAKLRQHVLVPAEPEEETAHRKQQSLVAPGMVCVAEQTDSISCLVLRESLRYSHQ